VRILFIKNYAYISIIGIYVILILVSMISPYTLEIVYYTLLLMILAQSLNIIMGFAGLYNFGHAAFVGIGAYTFAILVVKGVDPYLSMIIGGLVASFTAFLLGLVVLRLKGPFFAISTLGILEAIRYFIIGTPKITGGAAGFTLFKYLGTSYNPYILVYILLILSVVTTIFLIILSHSSLGYSLKALREDHDAAEASGVNTTRCKIIAFILSAFFPGVAGGVIAFKTFWVMPETIFDISYSIEAILTVLLGGSGTIIGPIIGAMIYNISKSLFMSYFPGFQLIVFGILTIIIILIAPEGVIGLLNNRFKKVRRFLI